MIKMMRKFLGTGAVIAAAVAFAAPAASAATWRPPVVYGQSCHTNWCDPDVRPHGTERWIFGAGNQYITAMTWSRWNNTDAYGHGTIHLCPSSQGCTRHHVSMYLHRVLWHNGRRYYQKVTLRWPGDVQRVIYSRHGGTQVFWG